MNKEKSKNRLVNIILHIHTNYSFDSNITVNQIINQCKLNNIEYVGITDHCTINGAKSFANELKKNGITVIISEEVMTQQGEVIGLFLDEEIQCKDSKDQFIRLDKAISLIQDQNGLVFVPHPLDFLRHGIGKKNLLKLQDKIDAIEVFNSRTKLPFINTQTDKLASQYNFEKFIGSDAHIAKEIPNAITTLENFSNASEFLNNLKKTSVSFDKRRFKLIDIFRPTINKIRKKLLFDKQPK
jgi:predicted metal-dependent phosphoesterase TrpH